MSAAENYRIIFRQIQTNPAEGLGSNLPEAIMKTGSIMEPVFITVRLVGGSWNKSSRDFCNLKAGVNRLCNY